MNLPPELESLQRERRWKQADHRTRLIVRWIGEPKLDDAIIKVMPGGWFPEDEAPFRAAWSDVRYLRRQRDGLIAWRPNLREMFARQFAEIVLALAEDCAAQMEEAA